MLAYLNSEFNQECYIYCGNSTKGKKLKDLSQACIVAAGAASWCGRKQNSQLSCRSEKRAEPASASASASLGLVNRTSPGPAEISWGQGGQASHLPPSFDICPDKINRSRQQPCPLGRVTRCQLCPTTHPSSALRSCFQPSTMAPTP